MIFFDKSGIGEVKTLSSDEPTLLDFKEFNYDNILIRKNKKLIGGIVYD